LVGFNSYENGNYKGAFELLKGKTGSNNVVFITDGVTLDSIDLRETKKIVEAMYDRGIKTFVVGVGRSSKNINSDYLKELGSLGGGFYLEASEANRLKILFGEPVKKDVGSAFEIVLIDTHHFITKGVEPDAVLYGYNQVIPKGSANLLATTDSGEPALVVWRYGIGRVGALTVFSGENNLGELLSKKSSKLLTRTINWIIADPERKNEYYIDIGDTRINRNSIITVKSNKFPAGDGLEFTKTDENIYSAKFVAKKSGFNTLMGASYSVNYDPEYQRIGFNSDFNNIVESSRGKLFKPAQVDDIIEHVKSVSRRKVTEQNLVIKPFILAALFIFLFEVCIRRIKSWFGGG